MKAGKWVFLGWMIPAAVFFAVNFALAARWDLAINLALYSPTNLLARLFEVFGWLPAFVPTVLLAMLWAASGRAEGPGRRWLCPLGGVLSAGCIAVLYYMCYHYLVERDLTAGARDPRSWLWLALGLVVALLAFWWVLRQGERMRHKLYFFALTGNIYLAANLVLASLLKMVWQRPRFDEMLGGAHGGLSAFSPWYMPFGAGGSSFPSGHTANACGVFMVIVLCDLFPSWNRHRQLLYIVCWGYVALMALSRILIGRHFFSDTLAAAGIMALLFLAMRRTRWYRQGLLRVCSESALAERGE